MPNNRDDQTRERPTTTWGDLRANTTDATAGDDETVGERARQRRAQAKAEAFDQGTVETIAGAGVGYGVAASNDVTEPGGDVGTGMLPGAKPIEPNLVERPHLAPAEGVGVPGERGVSPEASADAGGGASRVGGPGWKTSDMGGPSYAHAEEAGPGGATVMGPGPTANQPNTLQSLEDAEADGSQPSESVTEG